MSISSTYKIDLLEEPKQLDISLVPTSDEYVIFFIGQYEMSSADQMPCSKLISYLYHFFVSTFEKLRRCFFFFQLFSICFIFVVCMDFLIMSV